MDAPPSLQPPRPPRPLRVVQWATGATGGHALAAVLDHPDLELVGLRVYGADKVGRDAGALCGRDPVGVIATRDRDEILALGADCVLYMPQGETDPAGALADVEAILASGTNVVSTAVSAWIHPVVAGDETVERLAAACAAGGTTFHATGIEPGWASEVLPLTMSGLFRRIDTLLVQELLDYSTYPSTFMLFDVMGFGRAPDAPVLGADPAVLGGVFRAPLQMVADGLGATIDEFRFARAVAVAERPLDVAAGRVEPGTVSAMRFSATAVIDGRPALTVEHVTRVGPDEAPDWPTGRGWRVEVAGEPSMVVEARVGVDGEDENDQGCLGTAMHAVHAVVPVCAAPAGIATFLDLPTILGRHVLGPAFRGVGVAQEASS